MYSRIVLSRSEADKKEDGMLEAWELMKLDLKSTLVVLSGCETARGKVTDGEGLIGMTWALFIAGAPAAVVTQWKVDSAQSAAIMVAFHRLMLQQSKSHPAMSKAEALQQAALKLLRGPYNHPAYWAAFMLVGDGD
jgi:CHAT domain-containing protein